MNTAAMRRNRTPHTRTAVRTGKCPRLEPAIGTGLLSAFGSGLEPAIGTGLESAFGSGLESAFGA